MSLDCLNKENVEDINEIKNDLNELKIDIDTTNNEKTNELIKIREYYNKKGLFKIPDNIIKEYLNFIKDEIKNIKEDGFETNNNIKKMLGLTGEEYKFSYFSGILAFYIKKLCPNKFKEISALILTDKALYTSYSDYIKSQMSPIGEIIEFIKQHGDFSYTCLKFCSAFEGSYMKKYFSLNEPIASAKNQKLGNLQNINILTQFFENFIEEPESTNLLMFLISNPQKLSNLGGKEIKEINLNIDTGINFTFRGIIEMVKSRQDLNIPHLKKNATNSEKNSWKQQWKKIIKEYENILRNYIAEDFRNSNNNSETKKITFDKIFYTTDYGDNTLNRFPIQKSGIQGFTGSEILDYSIGRKPVKSTIRKPIKIFGNKTLDNQADQESLNPGIISSGEIQLNGTGIRRNYSILSKSEQLRFRNGQTVIREGGYIYKIESGNLIRENLSIENGKTIKHREVFSKENGKMIPDIENYVKEHPQEKVLVLVAHHGDNDGSSLNGRSREDWTRLANISQNVKIWSYRCYFGTALDNENIYKHKSPVSGFSNNSVAWSDASTIMNLAIKKGLGFNELEIYTRLNYLGSVTPLTENMKYTNQKTGKIEIGKIGIAQNDGNTNDTYNHYS